MTKQEIQEKIKKAEAGLANDKVPAAVKPKLRQQIDVLKAQLADMDKPAPAAVEKAQEAASTTKKEQESMSEAEIRKQIAQIKAGLANDKVPASAKPKLRARLAELQELVGEKREDEVIEKKIQKLEEKAEREIQKVEKRIESPKTPQKAKDAAKKGVEQVKKQVKEAKKEAEKEKAQRKRGRPKKAAAPAKPAKAEKKAEKPARKEPKKPVTKRKTRAEVKYEKAITNLQRLVNRTKELREKYKGQGVDLDRDAKRAAKPFGWRVSGSNRRATRADIKSGAAYWEGRPNRADVKKTAYPKLAKGGMMAKGGISEGAKRMLDDGFSFTIFTDYPNHFIHIEKNKNTNKIEYIVKTGNEDRSRKLASFDTEREAFKYLSLKAGRKVNHVNYLGKKYNF